MPISACRSHGYGPGVGFRLRARHQVRVALLEGTHLERDIIREVLAGEPDIKVVAELRDQDLLPKVLARTRIDVVILGLQAPEFPPPLFDQLLLRHRNLRLLAVRDKGRRSFLYELRPQSVDVGELSPQTLLAVLRGTT